MGLNFWIIFGLIATMAIPSLQNPSAIPSVGTSLSYLSGPVLIGETYTWSKVYTPVTVGTVLITINKANGKSVTTTVYHSEYVNSKGMAIFTPSDINAAGTRTRSFEGGHTAVYPTNYFAPGSRLTWAAMMPISSTGTYIALRPGTGPMPVQTISNVITDLGRAGTCCYTSTMASSTPSHTPFPQNSQQIDKADPRGWLYQLVGAGANGMEPITRLEPDRVSELWYPTHLGISYKACLHSICQNINSMEAAPVQAVGGEVGVFATSTAIISVPDETTSPATKPSSTTIPQSSKPLTTTIPSSTKPPTTTTPSSTKIPTTTTPSSTRTPTTTTSSTKTLTTTPSATSSATPTTTTHSTNVAPTPSTPSTKNTGLVSSQGSPTNPTIESFPFPTDTQNIILVTKPTENALTPLTSILATKITEDALTPTRTVVSTSSTMVQMSLLSTASSTPAAALSSIEVKTDLSATSRGTSTTTFSSNKAKDPAASPSTPSLSATSTRTTSTSTTSRSITSTKTTSTSTISSAKSNNSSILPSSTTQTQGEWKPMMQTTLPSKKAITSTMSFSGLAVEQVMAPVYMISGQKLMVDTPVTIGSMSPRTVIRLATSGSELVLAMSTEGPKSTSAVGTSTTSVGTSQGQQISTTSTSSTIGIGQMINQGLGGPTPGAPATTSVGGVEYVTKSFGTSLRYSIDKMVRIRIELGLLSAALVMLVLM